jgi:hypothetical protein
MSHTSLSRATIAALLLCATAASATAQGKAKSEKKSEKPPQVIVATSKGEVVSNKKASKAARKRVSTSQAVVVTREVLVTNGYQIVNVVPTGTTQVIYYRRGNRGNGRGLGPVQKIVIVPSGEIVSFQSVPDPLLSTILRRLGL